MNTLFASRWVGTTPLMRKGIALVLVASVIVLALVFKNQIGVALRSGDTISAVFNDPEGIVVDKSKVKLAGLQVGVVTDVKHEGGKSIVKMKVDRSALGSLGSSPSARIEPLTILGGEYSIELANGGTGTYDGTTIPEARTGSPVELDRILEALPAKTRTSTRGLIKNLSSTLDPDGRKSLRDIADVAPPVLHGADTFLVAAQGTSPSSDLNGLVSYLQDAAQQLKSRSSEVDGAIVGLDRTSRALAQSSASLSTTIDRLPATLDHTETGLTHLDTTLGKLQKTADELQPTAERAKPLIDQIDPLLKDARPVVAKLAPITRDAIPTVQQLIPTVRNAHGLLDNVGGTTLARIRGPVLDKLGKPWSGKAAGIDEYSKSGTGIQTGNKYYEEIAYMVTNLARASMTQDGQGSMLNFQAGVGAGSLAPLTLDQALANLVPEIAGAGN
ncbi:MAG: Phospholipid/cholesterol/gamma-HCH transport system substrate-binding protein [Aeromicrobium sp.]|nr:Phospholipid/cholesterol/gamma-HCH transport system substrate-binding protein [Aeromicrobium sp.]